MDVSLVIDSEVTHQRSMWQRPFLQTLGGVDLVSRLVEEQCNKEGVHCTCNSVLFLNDWMSGTGYWNNIHTLLQTVAVTKDSHVNSPRTLLKVWFTRMCFFYLLIGIFQDFVILTNWWWEKLDITSQTWLAWMPCPFKVIRVHSWHHSISDCPTNWPTVHVHSA